MAYPEQKRIFAMIPALANAEILRFGSIHSLLFLALPSPVLFRWVAAASVFFNAAASVCFS